MQSLTGASQSGKQQSGEWSRGPLQWWETPRPVQPWSLYTNNQQI